ncbi:hypothetical protein MLD38_036135 [Melastoma candidum]|uniref:Uncharacterized protein n=1 Tax=Melastoma candidum TaxID=119954 RepID=A0ACB9LKM4_9MYRT|nr:hypothetical protein MLD38_036135 [Melastoma candidum]
MAFYKKHNAKLLGVEEAATNRGSKADRDAIVVMENGGTNLHGAKETLLRHRVVAQVLELGIVVHSVVIGLSWERQTTRARSDRSSRPFASIKCSKEWASVAAEFGMKLKAILVFFFSATTPFGIALGIGLSNVYSEDSPTALIVVGLLNASSAGLLNYMALVDLLGADFMGPRLQASMKLQGWAYVAVLLGAGLMALMAKWA